MVTSLNPDLNLLPDPDDLFLQAESETHATAQVCRITRAMEFMTDQQKASLERAFKTQKVTGAAIARTLWDAFGLQLKDKYGIESIKPKTAQRHRRGECGCEQAGV
jgi:hypothetical protein